jgi:hypothetical protein
MNELHADDTSTGRADDTAILRALALLELKLTELIRSGIAAIQQEHNRALLEQAKLNAQFATRDRVEQIARQVDGQGAEIIALHREDAASVEDVKELRGELDALVTAINGRTLRFFTTTAGWLVAGMIAVVGPLLSFLLYHLFK